MVAKPFLRGTKEDAEKSKKLARRYFYLDDKLYKRLGQKPGYDIIKAWNYTDSKLEELSKTYVAKHGKKTFTVTQAAAMLNRSRMYINHLYLFASIPAPQKSMPLGGGKNHGIYRLSEKDMYRLHAHFAANLTHEPKPGRELATFSAGERKPLPTRRELTAMMKYERITYVKNSDGEFVPTWGAPTEEDFL